MTIEEIASEVEAILPEIIRIRHQIHRNPELAGKEFITSNLVRKTLKESAIELLPPFLETDVIGILNGRDSKSGNVTLRADMDALPLEEITGVDYSSEVPGCMHACGHDGHTAMLLGTALVLDKLKTKFTGSVRFVFQPGEEVAALGKELVEAGALMNPEPDFVCAIHGFNNLPVGSIASKPGAVMAAAGMFTIDIKGKGGHGSMPHTTINPLLAACRIVEAIQSIPVNLIDAQTPAVVSVCRINSGSNSNVIPDKAVIEGTFRFFDQATGNKISESIKQIAEGVSNTYGAECKFEYDIPYIPTINNPQAVDYARQITEKYLGSNSWIDLEKASMGAEDFSFYLEKYTGVHCRLGLGDDCSSLHNPNFDFNDDALRNGIIFMVGLVMEQQF